MSPQQAQGQKIDHLSDVYALGAIYYRMLATKPMIEGKSIAEIIFQVIHKEPPLLRQINNKLAKDLEAICYRATAKKINKRYQSARELSEDIDRFLHGEIIKARRASILERSWHKLRKNASLVVVSLVCILLLCAGPSLSNLYQNKKLEKQVRKYLKKAQKKINKADSFIVDKKKQIKSYSDASDELEKALALAPNLDMVKTKYFKTQKKIGDLAKKQKNYLLAYAIFKQCKKRGFAKANDLLKILEKDQGKLKQKYMVFIEKTMNEIGIKIQEITVKNQEKNFKQQKQVIDWYMFKIIQVDKSFVLEKLTKYLKSSDKWQRILAIRAIGRLRNNYSKFTGKDSVEWLLEYLGKFKNKKAIHNNWQEVEEIIWALGWLKGTYKQLKKQPC